MTGEYDSFYHSQTVEDETMLFALELSGDGMTHAEIAYGLWNTISYFAEAVTSPDDREGLAELLESLARCLRTQPPTNFEEKPWMMPEQMAAASLTRLQDQAEQEGRA